MSVGAPAEPEESAVEVGHDLVIVANRLPVHHESGDSPWEPSPGGLVRAMLGVIRTRRGAWVGWSGLADDAATAAS